MRTDSADSGATVIGTRVFSDDDQRRFATWSGDRNPIHMDPVAARRLITGRQVVHGIHVLLHALELWRNERGRLPRHVGCTFSNPICVGDEVRFTEATRDEDHLVVDASVDGLLCARLLIDLGPPPARSPRPEVPRHVDALSPQPLPLDAPPASHVGRCYRIPLAVTDVGAAFPRIRTYFGTRGVASIAALSYFVGMVCPGLHSIFSSLTLAAGEESDTGDHLDVEVLKYDPRVRLFDAVYAGAIRGTVRAFLRTPPQDQPTVRELSAHIAPGEFRGTRSLVIGGSRGLGELTAKALAAGGGDVVITYASGLDDARSIQRDIEAGGGRCEILRLDLTREHFNDLDLDWSGLTDVYFFATPRIYRKRSEMFTASAFAEFVDFYIVKFMELCQCLEAGAGERKIRVFVPSSVFVSERPRGMTEYAMAKAAAEVLVEDVNRTFKHVWVFSSRLPRLTTDQTASILKVSAQSNLDALLPVVRSFVGSTP